MTKVDFPQIPYAEWRRRVETELGGLDLEDSLTWNTDGVRFEALCTAEEPEVGEGVLQVPVTERPWIPCQSFEEANPEELNQYLKSALAGGVEGLRIRIDRIGGYGLHSESSDPGSRRGVRLFQPADYGTAFRGSAADWKLMILDAGGHALPVAAQVLSCLESGGIGESQERTVLLGADPFGTLAAEGRLRGDLQQWGPDLAELVQSATAQGGWIRVLSISTEPYREAGAEIDQELGIGLATGTEYLRLLEASGVEPETAAGQIAFQTSSGRQIFLEMAKLRALRVLWQTVLRSCGLGSAPLPWIHVSLLQRSLATRELTNNLLRLTAASWAAVAGGADSLETPAYDGSETEAGSERGRRMARNAQLILALEAQMGRVADPGRGSYFLEAATRKLAVGAWQHFQEIERRGGLLECLTSGWLQETILARWDRRRAALRRGQIPLLGVNVHADAPGSPPASPERAPRESSDSGRIPEPSDLGDVKGSDSRFQDCLDSVARGASIQEMHRFLYGSGRGLEIKALPVQQDSQACEEGPDPS